MTIRLPTKKGYLEPNTILKKGIFKPSFLSELCFSAHAYAFFFKFSCIHSFLHSAVVHVKLMWISILRWW